MQDGEQNLHAVETFAKTKRIETLDTDSYVDSAVDAVGHHTK